ncbi:putative beta-lysine N-acetyltransferase [Sediminispirochaeta smaragdinae]|uniref:GCN5-related N-acetyltransferase n=1 Tax=Sediminispirochaeta smaragdinae (strain DSM 11293 / JCM 15392 / SEBR 4228) TaxID=573413 RepID=E1R998_SEDSS|nr:putative beta-lysine N-acetyltransferase [Sediminispirochaeta smaragdinae]ADK83067.1 GCN5-related N-acetyltransferase [Sediminispirochaeta smaragdinae DSM 11293]
MNDVMQQLEGALIQHGPDGDRIYLMALADEASATIAMQKDERLIASLLILYRERGYSKIFAKVPMKRVVPFLLAGFCMESTVPRLFRGQDDVAFLAYYGEEGKGRGMSQRRQVDREEMRSFQSLLAQVEQVSFPPLAGRFRWFHCVPDDIPEMAELYGRVFDRYPFPIDSPAYLKKTMESHVKYLGIRDREDRRLIALASVEYHAFSRCVEMTDFAVLPEARGAGLALFLLGRMEQETVEKKIPVAYTIARLKSLGMNATFLKGGYHYAGTLPNNTFIGGGLESMNVYYKVLLPACR